MPAQKYPGAAVAALTTSSFNSTDLNIDIDDSTGWPDGSTGKFVVVVEPGTNQAEKILVTSRAGLVLTVAGVGDRGFDGTAAVGHGVGKTIRPSIDAASVQRHEDHLFDAAGAHAASAITNTPSGSIVATNVQDAIDELASTPGTSVLEIQVFS